MIAPALRLELRRSRALVGGLVLVVVGYGGFMAAFYPTLAKNTAALDEYLKILPREFLVAFGMEGSLADPGVFFTTYVGSWLWPIVAAIAAIVLATRVSAADTDRGWIELPLATPLSRTRYLLIAIAVQAIALALLAVAAVAAVVGVGAISGAGFDAGRFFLVTPLAFAFACTIAAVTTLLGVVTMSRGAASGAVAGGLIAMYLLDIVAKIEPSLDALGALSAFRYFRPTPIIDRGEFPFGDLALFSVVAVAAWAASLWAFRRRDLIA
ncbi:MAG: hypothetical protein A2X23_11490 [Chloroflexi bacterium GWC2_73_18]|nr:MAG: hypothetical protein A2X23_11490 [Chloroflexi bacterium GWC2_73_18]